MVNLAHWWMRSVGKFETPKQISMGFVSWLCYCTDVTQQRSTKLCTMFGRLLAGTLDVYFGGFCPLMKFCQVQRFSLFDQWHWREGATYIWVGGCMSCWALAHVLVYTAFCSLSDARCACLPNCVSLCYLVSYDSYLLITDYVNWTRIVLTYVCKMMYLLQLQVASRVVYFTLHLWNHG